MALVGFEHVGMTVKDLDACVAFYVDVLGLRLVVRRRAPDGGNEVCFLAAGDCMLEIIAWANGAERSVDVADGYAGLRHLTFAYDDLDAIFAKVEAAGAEILERPRRAHNRDIVERVAFCRDPDGIIIELCERAAARRTP